MFINKMFFITIKILISSILFFVSFNCTSQNWTGNVNSDWNNPSNWTGWPLNGVDILIDPVNYTGAAASPIITANSVFIPAGMIVQNTATLTIQANLTTTKRVELFNNGTALTITSGTVFASGSGSQGRFIVSDGAAVTMNGGLLKVSQRLIIELGGVFALNNGTVNPIQELAIGDGNAFGSSLFDMNGGLLTIGQDIGFENEAGLYYPTFDMSGGTLLIGGGIVWLGVAPGAGTPKFIMTGGTGTIGGDIINDPATTVDLYMNISGNANLAFNGAAITTINTTDSVKLSGASLLTLSNTHAINNAGVWSATDGTVVCNGNSYLQGTGMYQFHHISINPTKTLQHVSPDTVLVTGNFTNNGIFQANLNTMEFSGNTTQFISGNSLTTFHHLTLKNLSLQGITLQQKLNVSGHLQLTNGRMNTTATSILSLLNNATSGSGSSLSYVDGPMNKTGDDSFVFPIGKNGRWRRLGITVPVNTTTDFTAEYFDQSYVNTSVMNAPLAFVSNIEYWQLDKGNASGNAQVTLYWEDAAASTITNCSDLAVASWNGSSWDDSPAVSTGICSGNSSGFIQANTVVNNSSGPVTFGFYTSPTVGTNESLAKIASVFPNPNYGNITLQLFSNSVASYTLKDATGRIISENELVFPVNEIMYTQEPAGIYLLELRQNQRTYRVKLIKY